LGLGNAGNHSALLGVLLKPVPHITITPLVGVRFDRQLEENDQGRAVKVTVNIDTIEWGGYSSLLSARFNESHMDPRSFQNNGLQAFVGKQFGGGASDSLRVRWIRNRWDFYVSADDRIRSEYGVQNNIRTRIEEGLGFANALRYGFGENFSAIAAVDIETRTIDNRFRYRSFSDLNSIPFNSQVHELKLEGSLALQYQEESGMMGALSFSLGERDEKHSLERIEGIDNSIQDTRSKQEQRLDNLARRAMLRGTFINPLRNADEIAFDGSMSMLRYDTPSAANVDDRDELLISALARYHRNQSRYLWFDFTAEVTLAHLVYLFKERSANNSWNRIIRFHPEMTYTPMKRLRSLIGFEVLANYTVFDFETDVPTIQSYSLRQFAFIDSTSYDISPRLGADVAVQVKLTERGELFWKEFSERPQQSIEEITFSPQLRYRFLGAAQVAIGFRSFAQNRFRYSNKTRRSESDYRSYGPTTSVSMYLADGSLIELQGWKEFQKQGGQPGQELSNMTIIVKFLL
jgi:hypothetical protein